jgi:hypothetical protein
LIVEQDFFDSAFAELAAVLFVAEFSAVLLLAEQPLSNTIESIPTMIFPMFIPTSLKIENEY